jgi:hypothetical protein
LEDDDAGGTSAHVGEASLPGMHSESTQTDDLGEEDSSQEKPHVADDTDFTKSFFHIYILYVYFKYKSNTTACERAKPVVM